MKMPLKKWIRTASNFIVLVPSRLICQMLTIFLELNSKGLYQRSRKEKRKLLSCFPVLDKTWNKITCRHFHVIVVQRCLRNVQKSLMHVESCCFADINLLLFCHSCCLHVSSLILKKKLLTNLKLSQQCQHCIYNHNKQRAPEVWTVSKHISLESQWWNWKHNTTNFVVDILQVNVKFFTGKTQ